MAYFGQQKEQKEKLQDDVIELSIIGDGMSKNQLGFKELSIRAAFLRTNLSNNDDRMQTNALGSNQATIPAAFVRKVFLLIGVMFGVVFLMCAIPFVHPPLMAFAKKNFSVSLISLVTFLAVYFVLLCCDSVRRTFPTNLISTAILTLSIGLLTMFITAFCSFESVLVHLWVTSVSCVGIALFIMVTKRNITSFLGLVFIIIMVLMMFGLLLILWVSFGFSRPLHIFYASLMALLFVVYLVLDIQTIMSGKEYEVSLEEHIFVATTLVMGMIRYYSAFILCIFSDRSRKRNVRR